MWLFYSFIQEQLFKSLLRQSNKVTKQDVLDQGFDYLAQVFLNTSTLALEYRIFDYIDSAPVFGTCRNLKGNFVPSVSLNYKLLRSTGIERELRNLDFELTPPVEVFLMFMKV
jgi:hypothetical protein